MDNAKAEQNRKRLAELRRSATWHLSQGDLKQAGYCMTAAKELEATMATAVADLLKAQVAEIMMSNQQF